MAEITALKPVPRHPARVQVYLDGRRWRAIPAAAASGLRVGMNLDPAAQQQIEDRSSEAAALERIGRLLVERPRSEAEVRQRLERAGYDPETTQTVIERLRRKGVPSTAIDSALAEVDEPQAAWAAVQRVSQRWTPLDPSARRQKLYAYLQRRGFDHDTIRLVLHRLRAAADGDSEETA